MRQLRRLFILLWILLLSLGAGRVLGNNWDFTTPGDPNRYWNLGFTTAGTYDDNFNSSEHARQSGFRTTEDARLHASIPLDRLFLGLSYDYQFQYPQDINVGGYNQTHSVNASANYTVNPRLTLTLNNSFISSQQPGLVLGPNNAPVSISNFGNYIYDSAGGGANYSLTPRWTMALNGGWDIWSYRTASLATNYNHQDYSGTIAALYALDARTTLGLNYQYSQDIYVIAGPKNGLNGYANNVFLSATRRFNPLLSLSLDAGYTIRNSEDGSQSTSPSGSAAVNYNYGVDSVISVIAAQSLSEASVGITKSFSAQQNTSLALQINNRITVRLRMLADVTYNYSSFTSPLPGSAKTVQPNQQAITGHVGLNYAFRPWFSAIADYFRADLTSSSKLIQPFSRDQVSVGLTFTY